MSNDQDKPDAANGATPAAGASPEAAAPSGLTGPIQPFSYSFDDDAGADPGPGPTATSPAAGLPPGGTAGTQPLRSTQLVSDGNSTRLLPGTGDLRTGTQPLGSGSQALGHSGSSQIDLGQVDVAAAEDGGDDDGDDSAPSSLRDGLPTASTGLVLGWVFSMVVHGLLLGTAALLVSGKAKVIDTDTPPTRIKPIPPREAPVDPVKPPEIPQSKAEIDIEKPVDPVQRSDAPMVEDPSEIQAEITPDAAVDHQGAGREEATSTSELGGEGTASAIGSGGGNSGTYGLRTAQGRNQAIRKFGGTAASEKAVDAALRWFKVHQGPNGSWDPVTYVNNCNLPVKCEPGRYQNDSGPKGTVIALTGYALLCYLGAGYDHTTGNQFKSTVRKGVEFLVSQQGGDGVLGKLNYEHAIATMALAEAYALSGDAKLRRPVERAIQVIAARQYRAPGNVLLGWNYEGPDPRQDSSITGWNVMALKSAYAAGFASASAPMEGAKVWLEKHWEVSNQPATETPEWKKAKNITVSDKSRFAYAWRVDRNGLEMDGVASAHNGMHSLECVGLVCGVFFRHTAEEPMMASLANTVLAHQVPSRYPCNTYYMYYNTLALFQLGGTPQGDANWTQWNERVRELLVNSQIRTKGCFDGSWDPTDTVFWGNEVGRLLHTAYCTLSLEVYYRYQRVAK